MAQQVPEAPTGSRTSSVSAASIRESSRQAEMHAPFFASWSPYAAGAFVGAADPAALAVQPLAAAADSRVPTERAPVDAWTQSVTGSGGAHRFLSLLEARNVTPPEMFEDVPAADDYLAVTRLGAASAAASNTASYGLAGVDGRYTGASSASPIKSDVVASPLPCLEDSMVHGIMGCVPCYDHEEEQDDWQRHLGGAPMAAFFQEMIPGGAEKQNALGSYAARTLSAGSCSFTDDHRSTQEFMSSSRKKLDIPPEVAIDGSGSVTTRRKSEGKAAGNTKKSRKEASKTSPPPKTTQPQAPKVNLGEKITALQQIVSPFGKTDRASVLSETIKYIKYLHEQIQLFSEPYMTKSLYKGRIQSGEEEKEKTGMACGLRSRGLCLVPVSWTSQVCRDDNLPDCWTPAYRSALDR